MSRGKYLSLEEARNSDKLAQFAKEHPSEGDADMFDRALIAIARENPTSEGKPKKEKGTK